MGDVQHSIWKLRFEVTCYYMLLLLLLDIIVVLNSGPKAPFSSAAGFWLAKQDACSQQAYPEGSHVGPFWAMPYFLLQVYNILPKQQRPYGLVN